VFVWRNRGNAPRCAHAGHAGPPTGGYPDEGKTVSSYLAGTAASHGKSSALQQCPGYQAPEH